LRALDYAKRQRPFERVVDFGTGTGLLALAAALLNAKRVLAVDMNPLCVKTAMENVRLNDLDKIVQVVEGPAEDFVDEPADVMVANIHYDVMETLFSKRNFKDKDRVIVSGLMRSQAREIEIQLEKCHFQIHRVWDHEMTWFTILAGRS
jgi:ribosomal protein L11 methyltransferase